MATKKRLYTLVVPQESQTLSKSQISRQTSKQGAVGAGNPNVESISLAPGQRLLQGQYRGKYSKRMADQFEELFDASAIEEVVFFGTDENLVNDGYYTLENVDSQPVDPRIKNIKQFDGVLTKVGTKKSHYRAVKTSAQDVTNPFGGKSTEEVGVPKVAERVRWFNEVDGTLTSATVQSTNTGEFGDVEIYDASNPGITDPTLIYDIPYAEEGKMDCRVWDDYGQSKSGAVVSSNTLVGSAVVGNSTQTASRWQKVFRTDHIFNGKIFIENGLARVVFDEPNNSMTFYQWDTGTSDWSKTSLGNSDWQPRDVDLTRIGTVQVNAQVEFEDTQSSSTYFINMSLKRGRKLIQWTEPPNSGSIPSGLKTLLDPSAGDSDRDPSAVRTVLPREDVRR